MRVSGKSKGILLYFCKKNKVVSKNNSYFKKVFEDIQITDITSEGLGVGRIDELVVFVEHAVPGDVVDVLVTYTRRRHLEGKIQAIKKASEYRRDSFCEHFGICGGCKWQHMSYEAQLKYKERQAVENIQRIGKTGDDFQIIPILASPETRFYRNKLEFTFSNRRWLNSTDNRPDDASQMNALGFHVPGFFDKIVDIHYCYLQPEPANELRNKFRDLVKSMGLSFYDQRNHEGFLRNMIVRNTLDGQLMVILVVAYEDEELIKTLMEFFKTGFPQITSLYYVVNSKKNDTIGDLETVLYHGDAFIVEEMEGLKFRIGPKSFFQTNSHQSYELYKVAREFAALQGNEVVYDLYTGTGTIANFVASSAAKVVGIEYVKEAVDDAVINSSINNISNTVFYAGDMAKVLTEDFVKENGKPDVIITDPPRAGMHADVVEQILVAAPRRIVYVSCNPATQARDIEMLLSKYTLVKMQAVDMFPHTTHVENVALLVLKA